MKMIPKSLNRRKYYKSRSFQWCYNGPRARSEFLVMLVAITDIYYFINVSVSIALLPLLMIKNSLLLFMVVRVGKISISVSISEKKENIEKVSYRMKKLVSPIPRLIFIAREHSYMSEKVVKRFPYITELSF